MATIRLSTTMKKMWRNAFANYTSGDGAAKDYNVLFNWGGVIKIYAGTINDLGASTLLMTVTNAETTIETDGNNENIIYSTGMNTASASGTANWFTLKHSHGTVAYGTVGTMGSGSDLEIGSTAITSGQQYMINSLRLRFSNAV